MGEAGLDELRRVVVDDPVLRNRLLRATDRQAFIAAVLEVAHERGIEVAADDVTAGLDDARRRRLERWV
jgi:EAL domain-containing protein (putative c-di-GMP-specific phosphodiesterase class I)